MKQFGTSSKGDEVYAVTLHNGDLTVTVLSWGAIIQDVRLAGIDRSLTLGSNDVADYEGDMRHHGSLIGPIVNRISTARIKIEGMMYELERNQDGRIHLHSGQEATHRRNWNITDHSDTHVTMTCDLQDGACGLPGNRQIFVTYRVTKESTLSLEITGTTDATTAMNFANHSYWNFDGSAQWGGHTLQIQASHFLPGDADSCPTGEIADLSGTEMDFRKARVINPKSPALDNNYCLSETRVPLRDVLTLTGSTGVGMTVATDQTGIQVYDGRDAIRPGHSAFEGLAVEAQAWPDAPNNRTFPSIIVTPDTPYVQATQFRFFRG